MRLLRIAAVAVAAVLGSAGPAWSGFEHFTQTSHAARVLGQDRDGNVWFAGDIYATRTNGVQTASFQVLPITGAGFAVTEIVSDRRGRLWFGSDGIGVAVLEGGMFSRLDELGGVSVPAAFALRVDRAGNLWIGRGTDALRFDGTTSTVVSPPGGFGGLVRAIFEDRNGRFWFGTEGAGVHTLDAGQWRSFTTADGLPDGTVTKIVEDRVGNIWVATPGNGVARYDGTVWTTFTTADGLAANSAKALATDAAGDVWVGTTAGLSRFDGREWLTLTSADGLLTDNVLDVLGDTNGNLWIAHQAAGLSRFDRTLFRTILPPGVPPGTRLSPRLRDSAGNIWFAGDAVLRYDGEQWSRFTTADGLPQDAAQDIAEGAAGDLWVLSGESVCRFDGASFTTYPVADSLADGSINPVLLVDHLGAVWVATEFRGAGYFDGSAWTRHPLLYGGVSDVFEDSHDNLWFALKGGILARGDRSTAVRQDLTIVGSIPPWVRCGPVIEHSNGDIWCGSDFAHLFRFDGTTWESILELTHGMTFISSIAEDPAGNLWFGPDVRRFNGRGWDRLFDNRGLPFGGANALVFDDTGALWLSTDQGLVLHEPDRVAPQTVITSAVPPLSPSPIQSIAFVGTFDETNRIEFSYSLDGSPWSPWSQQSDWLGTSLADGVHVFRVRARDFLGNVDGTPAQVVFEIDATPPAPVLASPAFGQAVRGAVVVSGTASDARFLEYRVSVRPAGSASWESGEVRLLRRSTAAVVDGPLADWNTTSVADGRYDLRVSVADTLGLAGASQVTVLVDNEPPWAQETSPARITAHEGGDVYSIRGELHLYFPPRAFPADDLVSVEPIPVESVPETLPSGAKRLAAGFDVAWGAGVLEKPATLDLAYAGVDDDAVAGGLSLYRSADGSRWDRLGGTADPSTRRLSLSTSEAGRYAVYSEAGIVPGRAPLSSISFTPRVFSPTGTFASTDVGIGFSLGRPASVTVKVYSRSGRLVREVAAGRSMNAGANLIRWDGRDGNGEFAVDDLYVVTVEALGQTQKKTLAVVR